MIVEVYDKNNVPSVQISGISSIVQRSDGEIAIIGEYTMKPITGWTRIVIINQEQIAHQSHF